MISEPSLSALRIARTDIGKPHGYKIMHPSKTKHVLRAATVSILVGLCPHAGAHAFYSLQQCKDAQKEAWQQWKVLDRQWWECGKQNGYGRACNGIDAQGKAAMRHHDQIAETCRKMADAHREKERLARQRDRDPRSNEQSSDQTTAANNGRPRTTTIPIESTQGQRVNDGTPTRTVIPLPRGNTTPDPNPVIGSMQGTGSEIIKNIAKDALIEAAMGMLPDWAQKGSEVADNVNEARDYADALRNGSSGMDRVEQSTETFKGVLQDHAMVGESGAAAKAFQDAALPVLRDNQRELERTLGSSVYGEVGNNLGGSGSQYRPAPAGSLPMERNPFTDSAPAQPAPTAATPDNLPAIGSRKPSGGDLPMIAQRGSAPPATETLSNPHAAGSTTPNPFGTGSTTPPVVVAQNAISKEPHPGRDDTKTCAAVRRGEIRYLYQWTDRSGNQCYSDSTSLNQVGICCR